jgi:hypothetical protein
MRRISETGVPRALSFLLVLASARGAYAASPAVDISVTRAPGAGDCPDQNALKTSIEHILGERLSASNGEGIVAEVAFTRQGTAYEASLRLRGEKAGERTLRDPGPECTALAEGVAVTMALLLEPRDAAPAEAEPVRETERREKAPSSGWLAVSAGPAVGLVGATSPALGAEVGVELFRHWSFRLGAVDVLSRSSAAGEGSVNVSLLAAHATICGAVATFEAAIRPALCAHAAGGVLSGEGVGYQTNDSKQFSWFAGGVGAELGGRLSRFVWGAQASLLVPTRSQSFSVEPAGIAYDSSSVAAVFGVRAGGILW